jgi:Cu2+-exporting ATPase
MATESQDTILRKSFPVLGMSCAGCASSVESILKSTSGVKDAGVNYANQVAWALFDEREISTKNLQKAVQDGGYDLIVNVEDPLKVQEEAQNKKYQDLKRQTIGASILAIPVFLIGMFFMHTLPYSNWISMLLTFPILFWYGRHFYIGAYKQVTYRSANMDTLVALSTGIAFIFSVFNTVYPEFWIRKGIMPHVYFEAAAVIVAFVSLGKLLEERAKSNTSSAIKKLMGMQAKTVRIMVKGNEQDVDAKSVIPGDIVIVKPGEKIPVDGKVISGSSYVDESMISGEPIPVNKKLASKVFAGTINQKGSFNYEAEKVGNDTMLAHIIKMVQEAQGSKAPVQKLVDKIAGIFVPVILGIALLTFGIWMLVGGEQAFTHALLTSITVLVIACPCALGLATPTAIMVGVGKGAEHHILIKDAQSLELAYKINAIVLDKTGTITAGKPAVTKVTWLHKIGDVKEFIQILVGIEQLSEHPLAEALVNEMKPLKTIKIDEFQSISGQGVTSVYNSESYFVGNYNLIQSHQISLDPELGRQAKELQFNANTVVYFADEKRVLAIIAIADHVKKTSAAAVTQLKALGIEVYMLTGDNSETAASVANEVGIHHFKSEVMPSDKAEFIRKLQTENKVVAMVGDGINDSEALAQADVSIAMGRGSDIAMDVAKITLITSDLQSIPMAIQLSRATIKTIQQNLFWAFIYNLIGIPLAAGALYWYDGFLLDPMIAGAAMALSSVSVVANSLRLKSIKL